MRVLLFLFFSLLSMGQIAFGARIVSLFLRVTNSSADKRRELTERPGDRRAI